MRTNFVVKNTIAGLLYQFIVRLLDFAVQTIFIYTLSSSYLGISSLFTNVITTLSIAELGFGSAITFALYKPLADKNIEEIKSLMWLYRKAYKTIGVVILILGLLITPLLPRIITNSTNLVNIYIVFILYLLNTVSSYFFFSYKTSIFSADQKSYVISTYQLSVHIFSALLKIVSLLVFRHNPEFSFYLFSVISVLGSVLTNLLIARKADKVYPYLLDRDVEPLDRQKKEMIQKNVVALSVSRVSRVALDSIDNLVLSSVLQDGVSLVGIYSNYTLIVNAVRSLFSTFSNALTASIGNLYVTSSTKKNKETFDNLHFLYFWLYGFCAICLWNLLNPFIGGIWINSDWLLSETTVFLLTVNFLIDGLMAAPIKFIQAAGLFWQARFRYIISAVVNIGLSIFFVVKLNLGIEGCLLATTCCLFAMVSLDPYIVYKNIFHRSSVEYYIKYIASFILVLSTGFLVKKLCLLCPDYSFGSFVFKVLLCIVVPNSLWFILFHKTKEFNYLRQQAVIIIRKIKTLIPGGK